MDNDMLRHEREAGKKQRERMEKAEKYLCEKNSYPANECTLGWHKIISIAEKKGGG